MTSSHSHVFGLLWGKSNASGRPNLLLQHLLDAGAVAELIWDRYLALAVREKVDACCPRHGRALFVLVCALHDVGKATPAFQAKDEHLAKRVQAAGLDWEPLGSTDWRRHHTLAGAVIMRAFMEAAGWDRAQVSWILPLIAGHHGTFPEADRYSQRLAGKPGHGRRAAWWPVQRDLARTVADEFGIDLAKLRPVAPPPRAVQLALAGGIIMADWIASGSHFPGIDAAAEVSVAAARKRAEQAWRHLRLRGGWQNTTRLAVPNLMHVRFGRPARSVQTAAIELARAMPTAGLILIEAPPGEGKTYAALCATEVLAAKFGADGVFVGMPTQATSDATFRWILQWVERIGEPAPIGLLHGKRRFNREWHQLLNQTKFFDIHDLDDGGAAEGGAAPPSWFLGPHRGLLTAITIATVDQLLHAATRTRHVMLRHLGLAGRVVVLDEVHAYDVYMGQFLEEALRWLGDAGVPVVLLSATLPPAVRARLVTAYMQGALRRADVEMPAELDGDGYPAIRSVAAVNGQIAAAATPRDLASWREPVPVTVEMCDERPEAGPEQVVAVVREALVDRGCVLVVRNTVRRAQDTHRALKEAFGDDGTELVLLHARIATGDREQRMERVLNLLGPPSRGHAPTRPERLVVVATQLAEQSFDVDVDLLISDLAPIDLLLQRVGRLHRHERPGTERGVRVARPRLVVVGMSVSAGQLPQFPAGSVRVYRRYPLLRAAALVQKAVAGGGWSIPDQVPLLVREGYDPSAAVPSQWKQVMAEARTGLQKEEESRRKSAEPYVLSGPDHLNRRHLAGLHAPHAPNIDDDEAAAVVRDGPETVEVVMLRRVGGRLQTLDDEPVTITAETVRDSLTVETLMRWVVRLPASVTTAAKQLARLSQSPGDPWLNRIRVLELDQANTTRLGKRRLIYDQEIGLIDSRRDRPL